MQSILNFQVLIPIGLLILQGFILLFMSIGVLKRVKILKVPYSGLEYSNLIVACAFLFSILFISISDITGLFQAFKTFQNTKVSTFSNTFSKFSQFFVVVLFFEILLALVSFFIVKILFGFKNSVKDIQEGNIVASVLLAIIVLSFAVIFQFCSQEIIEYITPQYLNFR